MGGMFGVAAKFDCVRDLFYGTDYHSHLGTRRGGMAVLRGKTFTRIIHNIENAQFRSKFEEHLGGMKGRMGIGCISDTEDQPLIIGSHLGPYAIVTVGRINNIRSLLRKAFARGAHLSEMSGGMPNATELMSILINQGSTFEEGIRTAHESIDGSCSLLILTPTGIYAARDRLGRTPLLIGEKEGALCAAMETCAFPNLGYALKHELGPGEIVRVSAEGMERLAAPGSKLRICAFLWVYYGFPASTYEGINVEVMRNRSGAILAKTDRVDVDMVAGVPDSGIPYAIGYANEAGIPYLRPFTKYTPTWPRSFMP
ncbi:MAG TPA: amidophosphoribosyltransferase, partial [bacterium]|nr:amidophosphoribosyltransferase [bacterium]